MSDIIRLIREDLKKSVDPAARESFQRFFKEKVSYYGVRTGSVGKIAGKYWKTVRDLPKREIFDLCEELYRSGFCEEAFIVSDWVPNLAARFEPADLPVFKSWIEQYITNWAACDGFCNHTLGLFMEQYPKSTPELRRWARSDHRWLKRAAAVSLIIPAKRGKFLKDVFALADLLLTDTDDMVQKGYGWLLKEASRLHRREVFAYVMKHKKRMPRTALRYAIELMPQTLKAKAMAK